MMALEDQNKNNNKILLITNISNYISIPPPKTMNYLRRRCTRNIQISPLTKITKLMPASYLFPFISAC